ncbi:MAG: permease [Chloroflexi bacterium]|nr:permease [Chloroflexota bacterium]
MDREVRRQLWRLVFTFAGLALLAILLGALLSSPDLGVTLGIFTTRFLGIFIEAVPFLLLGTVVSGLIDAFVRAEDIARIMPRNPAAATGMGAFLGFAFPVCECGVVPVVRRLYTKGLPMSVGVTFLLAAPVVNPIVLASTFVAFGVGPVLIGRFVITIVVAIAVGLVFALAARPQDVLRPNSVLVPVMGGSGDDDGSTPTADQALGLRAMPGAVTVAAGTPRPSLLAGLRAALSTAGDEFFEMGRYLIIGSMLAAGMQTLVSQDVLLSLGSGPVVSVIVMQILAFVLSVCSTVDSFLALAFAGTFTTGSILAFLTFGPMVDIKSTLMFLGVFKRRVVLYLILLPMLMTMLIGIWINLNLSL